MNVAYIPVQYASYPGVARPPPDKTSLRLLWIVWMFAVSTVLMNTFAGQLKVSMMFKPEKARIEDLRDLYDSNHEVYIPKDSAGESALKVDLD